MIYNENSMSWPRVASLPFLTVFLACATTSLPVPKAWMSTPQARRVGPVELGADGNVRAVPRPAAPTENVRIETRADGAVLVRDGAVLTPPFAGIHSFDVSLDRREIAFSAKRADNFDVALVALEGSPVNWVPEDPADETDPKWALRGNKFSYVVRTPSADYVRTVHVLTAFQLTIPFADSVVNSLVWDTASERFAVTFESPESSERVDVMKYAGDDRRSVVEPAVRLDYTLEPFGSTSLLMRPSSMRYEEKLPVVVWMTTGRLNEWDDARAALLQSTRAACIVTTGAPDETFWDRVRAIPWADTTRMFIVNPTANPITAPSGVIVISGSPDVASGRYRRKEGSILVAPAGVKSFAAGFVSEELRLQR